MAEPEKQNLLDAFGGRAFVAGTALAGLCLAAGMTGRIPMDEAVQYALLAFGIFAGKDSLNTWAHRLGDAQEAAANARKVVAQIQAGQNPPTNKLP